MPNLKCEKKGLPVSLRSGRSAWYLKKVYEIVVLLVIWAGTSCLGSFLDSFGLSCVDEIHFSIMVLFPMLNVYLGIISPETYFISTY